EDKENNPCIYKGMPLHTEYRVFVDFDTDEVLDRKVTDSITLGHVLKSVFFSTPLHGYEHLAFLDTPGYSKPDAAEYSVKTDEQIARGQLNTSNFILWFVPLEKNGTISQTDIDFIRTLREDIPKMVILSQSDKKDISNLHRIIERTKADLNLKGIRYVDVRAFSSRREQVTEPELTRFLDSERAAILAQLDAWDAVQYHTNFAWNFKKLFTRCKSYYEEKINDERRKLARLNHSRTVLDGDAETMAPLDSMIVAYQSEIVSLEKIKESLKRLQDEFFKEIKRVSDQVGIQMPEPAEIDLMNAETRDFGKIMAAIQKEFNPAVLGFMKKAAAGTRALLQRDNLIENPLLQAQSYDIQNGYFKTLALIPLAQGGELTDGQRAFLSRLMAEVSRKLNPAIMRQAQEIELKEYDEYMDKLKGLSVRYRFALDAILLACCDDSQNEDALVTAAAMSQALGIDQTTGEYLCALAKSVLEQDSDALWRTRSMEKRADCEEGLFYDYIRQFINDWVFISDTRIDIRFLERKSIETISRNVLVHMENIANSTSNEQRTAFFENVFFPGRKSMAIHHAWAFRNYDEITFKNCAFHSASPTYVAEFQVPKDPKLSPFKQWDSWKRCLYFADVNRIQFEECGFYNCNDVLIGEKNVQNALFEKCHFENCLLLHMGGYGWSPLGALIHDDGTLGTNMIRNSEFTNCGGIGKQLIEVSAFLSNCKCVVRENRFVRCRHYCGTTSINPKKTDNEKGKKATLFLPGTVDEYNTLIDSARISDTPGLMKFCDIKQGRYYISTALKNNMLLDVGGGATKNGTNVRIYSANRTDAQDFTIQHVKGEWYVIKHTASGKVLDVAGKSPRSGTNVFLWEYLGADNQLWGFIPKNGGYMIQSKLGTYLDVCGAGTRDGTNVWAYEKMNNDAQLWHLTSV
ncbi:MAG: RICIN domain-containing protein, partial [Oscillibacter sp.]|nr:RICIN domain-containing protein [Oscillibacter sp.]